MPLIPDTSTAFLSTTESIVEQTEDATPKVIFSHPLSQHKVAYVKAFVLVFEHTLSFGAVGKAETVFGRKEGNVLRVAAPKIDVIVNTFGAPNIAFSLLANTATQSIDVQVTGKAGMTIRWHLRLNIDETP